MVFALAIFLVGCTGLTLIPHGRKILAGNVNQNLDLRKLVGTVVLLKLCVLTKQQKGIVESKRPAILTGAITVALFTAFIVGCSDNSSAFHPEDTELAPVDWSRWSRPQLSVYIESNDIAGFRDLIQRDPSVVNEKAANGSGTPLFSAVKLGRYEMVTMLVERGANVNEQLDYIRYNSPNIPTLDMRGWMPIHAAVEKGDTRMVRLLVSLGATTDVLFRGKSLDTIAREHGHVTLATLLESGSIQH